MMRMMVAIATTAFVILGASSPASGQVPPPPPHISLPTNLNVIEGPLGTCFLVVLPDSKAGFGDTIRMWNSTPESVTITQRDGFWTKTLPPDGRNESVRMRGAGTYLSACAFGQWEAPIKVLPKAPAAPAKNSFRVTWADDAAPATWRFGVQYRVGQGVWKQWKSNTAFRSAIFVGANGKTYFFRARTARTLVEKTDWSPSRRVVT
jgi:hypothetical protein